MKYLLPLIFIFSANAELDFTIELDKGNKVIISKQYVGEPVSKPRVLVIKKFCNGQEEQIFRQKKCDFNEFNMKKSKLEFKTLFYNPDTGICDLAKTENNSLEVSCK